MRTNANIMSKNCCFSATPKKLAERSDKTIITPAVHAIPKEAFFRGSMTISTVEPNYFIHQRPIGTTYRSIFKRKT